MTTRLRILGTHLIVTLLLAWPFALAAAEDDEQEQEPVKAEAQYLKLHPAFVVNLKTSGRTHYLQVIAEAMTRDTAIIESVKHHMPAIRHQLLLLFGDQDYQAIKAVEGKQALLKQALKAINGVLEEETGQAGVEAVYFTSFVIQ